MNQQRNRILLLAIVLVVLLLVSGGVMLFNTHDNEGPPPMPAELKAKISHSQPGMDAPTTHINPKLPSAVPRLGIPNHRPGG